MPSEIGASESEEVGVEHLLRDVKDMTLSTLANRVTQKLGALKGLVARWKLQQFASKVKAKFDETQTATFASSQIWDDGIVEPTETRQTLALALSIASNAELTPTEFGVFRM